MEYKVNQDQLVHNTREYDIKFVRSIVLPPNAEDADKDAAPVIHFDIRQEPFPQEKVTIDLSVQIGLAHQVVSDELSVTSPSDPKAQSLAELELIELPHHSLTSSSVQYFKIGGCLCRLDHAVRSLPTSEKKKQVKISQKVEETPRGFLSESCLDIGKETIVVSYLFQILQYPRGKSITLTTSCVEEQYPLPQTERKKDHGSSRKNTMNEDDMVSETTAITDNEPKRKRKNSDPSYRRAHLSKSGKGDKKNVVKNFVKAFRGFVHTWGEEKLLLELFDLTDRKKLDKIRSDWTEHESNSKYNNRLVRDLLMSDKWSKAFSYFLQKAAGEWLRQSGVADKKSHLEVLKGYIKASIDEEELRKIVCLKSRTCDN